MAKTDPDFSGKRTLWLDQGWQPAYIGFCPSKQAWKREMKRLGASEPWPDTAGRTTVLESKGKTRIIVTLNPDHEAGASRIQVAGLLAHEAVHVWQFIKQNTGVEKPDWETEAYSVQAIFQNLYRAWWDVRGHLRPADKAA